MNNNACARGWYVNDILWNVFNHSSRGVFNQVYSDNVGVNCAVSLQLMVIKVK